MRDPRILVITSLFPRPGHPLNGIFNYRSVRALSEMVELETISPVSRMERFARSASPAAGPIGLEEDLERLAVIYPRFFTIPLFGRTLNGYLTYRAIRRHAARLHSRRPFDLILCYWIYPDGYAASLLAARMRLPYVLVALGSDLNLMVSSARIRRKVGSAIRGASRIIAVSEALGERAVSLGADPSAVAIVPNGVDTETFHPMDRLRTRSELGLGRQPVVLFVGKLDPVKGPDVLLEALSLVPEEKRPLLLVAGGGAMGSGLAGLAQELGIAASVRFLGTLAPGEVAGYLNAADVLCLPSRHEGCPNVVLEALACGTPVVATRVGGVPEIVRSPETGILVDPGDPRALAGALEEALRREWNRTEIASSSTRTWRDVARETLSVIRSALEQSGSGARAHRRPGGEKRNG